MRGHAALSVFEKITAIVLSLGVLLPCVGNTAAEGSGSVAVYMPDGSELEYERKAENREFISFSGDVELTGVLLAYWQLDYLDATAESLAEAGTEHSLLLRFYPDRGSARLLPRFAEGGQGEQKPVQRIFLYHTREEDTFFDGFEMSYGAEDSAKIRNIVSYFTELPEGFLEDHEGKAVQPVSILVDGLASFIEGNHRFMFGKSQAIRAISLTEYSLAQIPDAQPDGYLSRPWIHYLYLVEDAAILDAPGGEQLLMLEAGTHRLERLGPPQNGWVKVRYAEEANVLRGYINAAVLKPVN
ncbi:hypothetical protein [Halopseudomonas salegens]|uniref:Uncharacterized protein n=1 Tax=Halopseudomonas salegens TaxID=1434072 RepID=A0A1H2HZ14_9GAMM|nr:hypothetical protein [Halopseudomonas salegens]SDU36989.1 hypothetical protein SAMN05216210_3417 [Halopseudomonas salegens]